MWSATVLEQVTVPFYVSGIGWCRAVADRPYWDDITPSTAADMTITFRIEPTPPPTNYKPE